MPSSTLKLLLFCLPFPSHTFCILLQYSVLLSSLLISLLVYHLSSPLECKFLTEFIGLAHHQEHEDLELWEWMNELNGWKSEWLLTCHWSFCFSDLCSWVHSPPQSGNLSAWLAQPWGDNIQRLSDEIQRQHSPCSWRAELGHSKWADSWDCWKNRFWWALTMLFSGCFLCISTGCAG